MAIKVNTAAVLRASVQLNAINTDISNGMEDVNRAMRSLSESWIGNASERCRSAYDYIDGNFTDSRFSVLNDFTRFIEQQVSEGYELTEQAVNEAARAFE